MKKENIETLIGNTTELFSSTAEIMEKTATILEDDLYNEEEGKLIIDTIYEVLGENGDKMPKYLIHCVCSKLTKTNLEASKLEKWYDALMKEN